MSGQLPGSSAIEIRPLDSDDDNRWGRLGPVGNPHQRGRLSRMRNQFMSFLRDLKIAVRSLSHVRALWSSVALTLGLGIGANEATFSVVRAVLLRTLANRDEDRLLYLRQSMPGIGVENSTFSVPEIQDMNQGLKTITELGTFSTVDFTVVGLG